MAYVPVPKDLSRIKTKLAFNVSKAPACLFFQRSGGGPPGLPVFPWQYREQRRHVPDDSASCSRSSFWLCMNGTACHCEKVLKNHHPHPAFLIPGCGLTKTKISMRCLAPERRRSRLRNSRRAGKPAGRKPEKQGLLGLFTKGKNIPPQPQTLPYREMYRDGVCRVADRYYTKTAGI